MEQNTDTNTEPVKLGGVEKRLANLKPAWKKGQTGNPKGHPKGQRNFATIYKEALINLAKINHTTPEALELEMIANGFKLGRKGDYRFYKDTLDRLHGQAPSKIEFEGEVNITNLSPQEKAELDKLL